MRREVADDQARGAGAEAVLVHGADRGVAEQRRVGEPEVVVGREVEDAPAVDRELGRLGAVDGAHPAAQPGAVEISAS